MLFKKYYKEVSIVIENRVISSFNELDNKFYTKL